MENRVLEKLDKIDDRLNEIDKTMVRNTVSLEEHIKRTEQNEEMIKALRADLKPVETHVKYMQGAGKLISLIAVIATIAAAAVKLFN